MAKDFEKAHLGFQGNGEVDEKKDTKKIDISGTSNIIEGLKKIPDNYRNGEDGGYYNQEVKENGDFIVNISDFGIQGSDIYGEYAKINFDLLIKKYKLDGMVRYQNPDFIPNNSEIEKLSFENFNSLTEEQKIKIIIDIAKNNQITINSELDVNLANKLRNIFILSYNNSRLRALNISTKIQIRKEVAEKLAVTNRTLNGTGYSIKVTNGLRKKETQKIIKENHALLRGNEEANRLFSSEENGPHMSGGAVDVELIKDGKKVDMKIGENNKPTYENIKANEEEKSKIEARKILLTVMYNAGFVVNPGEFWHFCYGDKMWAYVTQKTSGEKTIATYDNIEN